MKKLKTPAMLLLVAMATTACQQNDKQATGKETTDSTATSKYLSEPVIEDIYTADPSAHVFDGKVYIYPSHDIDAGTPENDMGDHFDMNDYHVLSMDSVNGKATDHGVALSVKDVPWAGRQMWAPDAAHKNGTYYLYFPAKDKNDVFRIGVATAKTPTGPFKAEPKPIEGSYSMDPAVFTDTDGNSYMYFGGIWGGQLQRWKDGKYDPNGTKTDSQKQDEPALAPRVAKMSKDMLSFDGPVKEVKILTKEGKEILTKDHDRRFFEASWVHKYNDKYYFTYSTGDTHYLAYAIGDNPMGPFVYQDKFMNPVQGWTTHHSIAEVKGKWYLFYHDTQLSNKTHLRNVKVAPLEHLSDGSIKLIEPLKK
jgi:beta-xylosidase